MFSQEGGDGMIKKDNLVNFKKMWTWLSGYPAHDQEYYMENVATLDKRWANGCPLADGEGDTCNGCGPIWQSANGTLCTDPDSPLYKWSNTSTQYPDYRSYYASQVAVLAMNAIRERGYDETNPKIFGSDYIHSQLHG